MAGMTVTQIEEFLAEPHVAVLSVSRSDRGPVAIPVWFEFEDGRFLVVTSPTSLHGRIIQDVGRATLTIRAEDYGESRIRERYVMAEGPIAFINNEIQSVNRSMRRRYHTGTRIDEWVNRPLTPEALSQKIAVLRPELLSGYEWQEEL